MASRPNDDFEYRSSWDVAIRFQDLNRLGHFSEEKKQAFKRRAVGAILLQALKVLKRVSYPTRTRIIPEADLALFDVERSDLDVISTLDHYIANQNIEFFYQAEIARRQPVIVILDTSLSMTGEKLALLAVTAAVVTLSVRPDDLCMFGFDSKIRPLKGFNEPLFKNQSPIKNASRVIERVLELPSGGFTNIELALVETERVIKQAASREPNIMLMTDGKYTEGRDPTYLAQRFKRLHVMKLGRDQAGRKLLEDLVRLGHGQLFEAKKIQELPKSTYNAIRSLLRS